MTVIAALVFELAAGQLGYVECSAGLEPPRMEGGRTELEFADLNNDGHVDIVGIGDHGSPFINTDQHGISVWFGNGRGGWDTFQFGNFGYGGIAVGDVNRDGHWDVGYGMHHNYSGVDLGDQLIEVALGDGTGRNWIPWDDSLAQEGQNWGMFSTDFADIDNDGDLDVGSISFGADDGIHVYLNLGNGAWRRSFGFLGGNSNMEFYFRDVNRDGNADLIAAHGYGSVWFGDGSGNFTPANTGLPQSSYGLDGLSVGDVDNDGGCDVAFANSAGGVEVWVWNDSGQVWQSRSGSLPASGRFDATQLCDMNADGFVDVCALGGGQVKVWTGNGAGNWVEAATITTPSPGGYSAFRTGADFDHNGRPDFVMVTREGSWPNDRNRMHAFRETTSVRELEISAVFPRGREKFCNGSVQFIDWWSEAPNAESTQVKLEFSSDGPAGPWETVADSLRNNGRFQWLVPQGVVSGNCFLRYIVSGPQGSATALTPRAFAVGDTVVGASEAGRLRPVGVRVVPSVARTGVQVVFSPAPGIRGNLLLLDAAGRVVRSQPVAAGAREAFFEVADLPDGAYFVRLDRFATTVGKLVKRQ
uniref:VCBS repeat-containing protein n=1 Tax=candidate division WOR-3 bacterium TaxID=2052148 RepID=A0A7C4CB32_UNCW3